MYEAHTYRTCVRENNSRLLSSSRASPVQPAASPFEPLAIISAIGYHGGHRSTGVLNNRSLIRHSGVHFASHRHHRRHSSAIRTAPRRCIRYKRSQIKISRRVFSSIFPRCFFLVIVFLFLPPSTFTQPII